MFEIIKKDMTANRVGLKKFLVSLVVPNGFNAILWMRFYQFLEKHRIPTFLPYRYLYHVHSLEFAEGVKIGGGLGLPHPRGLLFCKNTQVGEHTVLNGNVRFTLRAGSAPKLGSHCLVGDGVIFLGVSEIGDHCVVGAGSVVTKKFPAGVVICGVPARVIKTKSAAPSA